MTRFLTVPMHVDALLLSRPREVVGPRLDITRAPWFGADGDGTQRDHFPQTPNVSAAIRHEPMASHGFYLTSGTHLHWAMPDALSRGTTERPESGAYFESQGLYFPHLPNRWMVAQSQGGKLVNAWLVESDFVHEWGEGVDATAYPIAPRAGWPHPYLRVGRAYPLLNATPPAPGRALGEMREHLTAIGPGDPEFAALYTACHSVFGHHLADQADVGTRFDVVGWYADGALMPLLSMGSLHDTRPEAVASVLALAGQHLDTDDRATTAELAAARDIAMSDLTGWALPGGIPGLAAAEGLLLHGAVTVTGSDNFRLPPDFKGSVAVGLTPTQAVSKLIAEHLNEPALETELAAIEHGEELADHTLDLGMKLNEVRHSSGFVAAGIGGLWQIRPHADTTTDAMAPPDRHSPATDEDLPPVLSHMLDQLNTAQATFDQARAVLDARRQDLFADWHSYMIAAYPVEDTADFDLDIDLLRDRLIPEALAACTEADVAMAPAYAQVLAHQARLEEALAELNEGRHPPDRLELGLSHGPRFWRPADPVIALEAAPALSSQHLRRHGMDHRAREDGLLECLLVDVDALPDPRSGNVDGAKLRGLLSAIAKKATAPYKTIAETEQGPTVWNPILIEWAAAVHPSAHGTNVGSGEKKFEPDLLDTHFTLAENACELAFKDASHFTNTATMTRITGRAILSTHGPEILLEKTRGYLETVAHDLEDTATEIGELDQALRTLGAAMGQNPPQDRVKKLEVTSKRHDELGDHLSALKGLYATFDALRADLHARNKLGTSDNITTFALGGFIDRLLMRRTEPQLPISDPLGFSADRDVAETVRHILEDANKLSTPEPGAPFLPLANLSLDIEGGRLVDTFGQFVSWEPDTAVMAAETMLGPDRNSAVIPPRIAQPAQLDFRWLASEFDTIETNDHPASTPICGWLVPNDFDRNVLVYETRGRPLGSIDDRGIWHPAPGDADAPAGPALIGNTHLARVVTWICTRPEKGFVDRFLSMLDSSLRRIDPADRTSHRARALLVGRPIAVTRARIGLSLLGPPARDVSRAAMQLRLNGTDPGDHGFGQIRFPVRIGEHAQLNDGLVGYFDDDDTSETLFAPQADGDAPSDHIKVFDDVKKTPLTVSLGLDDGPRFLTLLLDPRCPVHATPGVLPTKAIHLPREHYDNALQNLQVTFTAMPVLMPPGGLAMPVPSEPGHSWSWLALENGAWQETQAAASVALADLRRALPGACLIARDGTVSPTDGNGHVLPLSLTAPTPAGAARTLLADLLWDALLEHDWLDPLDTGRALLNEPPRRGPLPHFPIDVVTILLTKITRRIAPAERHGVLTPRAIAREGWLRLTPKPHPDPGNMPAVAPEPPEPSVIA